MKRVSRLLSRSRIAFPLFPALCLSCGNNGSTPLDFAKYSITGTTTIFASSCTSYLVTRTDLKGNASNVSSDTVIVASLSQGSQGTIYIDSGCTQVENQNLIMRAGSNTVNFWYKAGATGMMTLTAESATNVADTAGTITITVQ